jgi:hypothetical protein
MVCCTTWSLQCVSYLKFMLKVTSKKNTISVSSVCFCIESLKSTHRLYGAWSLAKCPVFHLGMHYTTTVQGSSRDPSNSSSFNVHCDFNEGYNGKSLNRLQIHPSDQIIHWTRWARNLKGRQKIDQHTKHGPVLCPHSRQHFWARRNKSGSSEELPVNFDQHRTKSCSFFNRRLNQVHFYLKSWITFNSIQFRELNYVRYDSNYWVTLDLYLMNWFTFIFKNDSISIDETTQVQLKNPLKCNVRTDSRSLEELRHVHLHRRTESRSFEVLKNWITFIWSLLELNHVQSS